VVFIQKAVKLKPNTLEIKFIHTKSVMIALCKCNSKMSTFLGGIFRQLKDKFALLLSILGQLKGKFILQLRQCFSGIPQIRSEGFHKSVQKLWRATFFLRKTVIHIFMEQSPITQISIQQIKNSGWKNNLRNSHSCTKPKQTRSEMGQIMCPCWRLLGL